MDFKSLISKINELDSSTDMPAPEAADQPATEELHVDQPLMDTEVEECGMPGMPMGAPKQPDNVSMNVSMNGSGAGGIRDLMSILRNIEQGEEGPGSEIDIEPERFGDRDMDIIVQKHSGMDKGVEIDDDFANQPDEMYGNMDSVTGTGNDIHSKGKEAPKVNGGGNPMPVESGTTYKLPSGDLKIRLESLYQEIKSR